MKPTRLLLDTHILLWAIFDTDRLNRHIYDDILDYNVPVYVSVLTLQEIVALHQQGRIDAKAELKNILKDIENWDISILNVTLDHVKTLEQLSHPVANGRPHEDPVDRMLISQAIFERLTLVSADLKFPFYKDHNCDLLQNF